MLKLKYLKLYCTVVLFLNLTWIYITWYKPYNRPICDCPEVSDPSTWVSKDFHPNLTVNSTALKTNKDCLRFRDLQPISTHANHFKWRLKPRKSVFNSQLSSRSFSVAETQFGIKVERELLHLVLYTRDSWGNYRTKGGDFFYATLSDLNRETRTAGKVIDYDNGTYSIYFYVSWTGNAYINVTLVNPREDVLWIKNEYRQLEGKAIIYGTFQSTTKKRIKESEPCTVRRREGTWKSKCEYRNKNSLGKTVLVCGKPPSLTCQDLKHFTGGQQPAKNQSIKYLKKENSIFKNNVYKIGELGKKFRSRQLQSVKSATRKKFSLYLVPLLKNMLVELRKGFDSNSGTRDIENRRLKVGSTECLSKCGPGLAEPVSDGYWSNNTWNSLVCNSKQWRNQKDILLCLKDKQVYFIGDSTLRQWYEGLVKLVGYRENEKETQDKLYRHYSSKLYNFEATFHFHFWAYSRRSYTVNEVKYMADFVDSLSDANCNYIVFLSASFHFTNWTRESYGEMLEKTKEAVDRLLYRCPNSIVVVKGSHTFEGTQNKWILHDMNLHLRQIFTKNSRVIFINVWDMHLSYSYFEVLHMPPSMINQELFLVFSHLCTNH